MGQWVGAVLVDGTGIGCIGGGRADPCTAELCGCGDWWRWVIN